MELKREREREREREKYMTQNREWNTYIGESMTEFPTQVSLTIDSTSSTVEIKYRTESGMTS